MCYRLPIDPLGIVHVGTDGVLRSLTADRKIIAALPLEPRHIKAHLDQEEWNEEIEACYRAVDGTEVPREQWFEPAPETLPPPLEGNDLEEAKRLMEENSLGCNAPTTDNNNTGSPGRAREACPITVLSDHNIVLKDDNA